MSDFYSALISTGIMLAEAWAMVLTWDAFALRRRTGWKFWCAVLAVTIFNAFFLNFHEYGHLTKALYTICIWFVCTWALYKSKWYVLLFAVVLSIVLLQAVDNAVFMGCSMLTGASPAALFQGYASFMILTTLGKTLEILLAYILKRQFGRRLGYPQKDWRSWLQTLPLPLTACGFMAASVGFAQKYPDSASALLGCTAALLLASILQVSIVGQLDKQRAAQQEQQRLRQNQEWQQERTQALRTAYADQRRLTHDFQNHLLLLLGLLHQDKTDEAVEMLENLQEQVLHTAQVVDTQNPLLDAILNQKYAAARECGVTLQFDLQNPAAFQMDPQDAAVVLGNLLDNAIEAARQAPDPQKVIFKLHVEPEEAVLAVKNTVAAPVKLVDGWVQGSTKADSRAHGYGLRNVRETVRRCGGEISLSCKEGWFTAAAILPQKQSLTLKLPSLASNC